MKLGRFVGYPTLNHSTKFPTPPSCALHKKGAEPMKNSVLCIFLTNGSKYRKTFGMKNIRVQFPTTKVSFVLSVNSNRTPQSSWQSWKEGVARVK